MKTQDTKTYGTVAIVVLGRKWIAANTCIKTEDRSIVKNLTIY
jgi:hypothetical protein